MLKYRNNLELFAFAVTISLFLTLPAGLIYGYEQAEWETFKEKISPFTFNYPAVWHIISNQTNFGSQRSLILSPDPGCYQSCDTGLGITFFNYNDDIYDLLINYVSQFSNKSDFNLSNITNTTLGIGDGYNVSLSYSENYTAKNLTTIKVLSFIGKNKNVGYYIQYWSPSQKFPRNLEYLSKIIKSISLPDKLTDNTENAGIRIRNSPFALSINPKTNLLYATNVLSNKISVINLSSDKILTTVDVGKYPYGVTADKSKNIVYVANTRDNTISVIDGETNEVVDEIPVGKCPVEIVTNSINDNDRVYTANYCSNSVSVIEKSSNTLLGNVTLGEPVNDTRYAMGITLNPFNNNIYVTNPQKNEIVVLDAGSDNKTGFFETRFPPYSVLFNPFTQMLYYAGGDQDGMYSTINTIDVINKQENIVYYCDSNNNPNCGNANILGMNPLTKKIYASTNNGTVLVINATNDEILNPIPVNIGNNLNGIAIDSNSNILYVADQLSNNVFVINGTSNNLLSGITFFVDPIDSGRITCNGKYVSNGEHRRYEMMIPVSCYVEANHIFPPMTFGTWSIVPPKIFDKWIGDPSSLSEVNIKNPTISFKVMKYGTLTANFKDLIPSDYMNTIVGTVLALALPVVGTFLYTKRKWIMNKFNNKKKNLVA
jgi:YVTN family beta-propeller protein